jgi:hypothetical protein
MLTPELIAFLKSRKKPGAKNFLNEDCGGPVYEEPPRAEKYAAVPGGPKQARRGVGNFSAESRRDPTIFYHPELAARNFRSSRTRVARNINQENILAHSTMTQQTSEPYVHAAFLR